MSLKNSRKVLILIPNFVGYSGGVVNEIQLAKSLCKERACIIVGLTKVSELLSLREFMANLRAERWSQNTIILPLPLLRPYTISLLLVSILIVPIIWLLDKLKYIEFIYVRSSPLAFGIMLVPSLARKACVKIPAIFEDEVLSWGRIFSPIYRLTDRVVLDKASCIGIASPLLLKEIALRRRIVPKGKIVWIPAGIDREKMAMIKTYFKSYKKVDTFIIGFIGSLEWWQGVDTLVKAFAKIKGSLSQPIKLLIVGDGSERRKIEILCRELEVYCHITGFVDHYTALRLLRTFDVLVLPRTRISSTESIIPIKVIEAWALGVPVITTRHKIYDYLGLRDREDVVFCEPVPDDVADKIQTILRDGELRRRLIMRGPELAKNYYYDEIARNLVKVIECSKRNNR